MSRIVYAVLAGLLITGAAIAVFGDPASEELPAAAGFPPPGVPAAAQTAGPGNAAGAEAGRSDAPLRVAVEALARRHGVRLVVDAAAAGALDGALVPGGRDDGLAPEAGLRRLLAGFELMFHYGADPRSGAERLKTVWVFDRAQSHALIAGLAGAGSGAAGTVGPFGAAGQAQPAGAAPAAPAPGLGLQDADESVRLQALHASQGGQVAALAAQDLRQLAESDGSEAVRMEALEAFLVHPNAGEDDIRAVLERLGQGAGGGRLLAEHARALQESRSAPAIGAEPIDPGS